MIHVNNWSNISPFPHLSFRLCAFWWAAEYAVFDLVFLLQIPPWRFSLIRLCVCVWASEEMWVSERESETVLCLRFAETGRGFADKRRGQVTAQRDYHKGREEGEKKKKKRHKRPSRLVLLHQPSVFPLTHGTQMKTDFKREDEKHSLLKAKCFTMGPCANTVVLSEKWTTVELTNRSSLRCASHTAWEPWTGLPKEALHLKTVSVAQSYAFACFT